MHTLFLQQYSSSISAQQLMTTQLSSSTVEGLQDNKKKLSSLKRTVILDLSLEERTEFLQFLQRCAISIDLIDKLPLHLTTLIFSYLTAEELSICRLVSRSWNKKATHDSIWRRLCQEYSIVPPSNRSAYNFNTSIPIYHDIFRRALTMCKTWNSLACKRLELHYHSGPVLSMLVTHTTRIITGDIDGKIHVFDALNQRYITCLQAHVGHVSCLAASTTAAIKLLASGSSDHTIVIHDLVNFNHLINLRGHKRPVTALAFCTHQLSAIHSFSRKKYYYTPLISGSVDKTIRIWDTRVGTCLRILNGQDNIINSLIYIPTFPLDFCQSDLEYDSVESNKAGYIISGSSDHSIFLWDLKQSIVNDQPEVLTSIMETRGPISAMALYNEHDYVDDNDNEYERVPFTTSIRKRKRSSSLQHNAYRAARRPVHIPPFLAFAASSDRSLCIFSVPSLENAHVLPPNTHTNTIWSVSAAPIHSKLVSTSGDGTAIVWDLKAPRKKLTIGGFDSPVINSAISPQEELLVFGTEAGTVVVFDMQEFAQ